MNQFEISPLYMHYVTLLSDKSEFLEWLSEPIGLDHQKYQVGLVELISQKPKSFFKLFLKSSSVLEYAIEYSSVKQLLNALAVSSRGKRATARLPSIEENVQVKISELVRFSQVEGKIVVELLSSTIDHIEVSSDIGFVLGFDRLVFTDKKTVAKYEASMDKQLVNINCDLCEQSHVGKLKSPVLKTVSANFDLNIEFKNVLYHNVSKTFIDSIKIEMKTQDGRLWPTGRLCLVLHIRPTVL
jgi:hypothetical protein